MIAAGRRSKALPHQGGELRIRQLAGAVRLDQDGDGVGHANGVSQLDLAALGKTGRDDILGDVAGHIGSAAVDLGRVLPGKGAAAVAGVSAVGIDDDLSPGQARVPRGTADDEAAGWVDIKLGHRVEPDARAASA